MKSYLDIHLTRNNYKGVYMKKFIAVFFFLALPLLTVLSEEKNDENETLIIQKAAEMVKDKARKSEKIIAVHDFVKEQISEITTQYG